MDVPLRRAAVAGGGTRAHDLVVVQHNVSDENADPAGTARSLADADPALIALEEPVPAALPVYEKTLAPQYPYHAVRGTVGLWSQHPLTGSRAVDIKPRGITESWQRGLRAVAHTPQGEITVYVAHLPSVRVGASGLGSTWRDESAGKLGRVVVAEKVKPVILMGDLNSTRSWVGPADLTLERGATRLRVQLPRRVPGGPDRPGDGPLGDLHPYPYAARDRQRPSARGRPDRARPGMKVCGRQRESVAAAQGLRTVGRPAVPVRGSTP
ncbi:MULTISPECIES: endonuclease/exonuclease/phosphatase family protein [unclassified Streptomyces]|uniref:endonuclease/exonuclease/phosphatase family protein n=1 Tax=unclassified Streptomyces TaxID=2593676 RepID=UPI00338E1B1A